MAKSAAPNATWAEIMAIKEGLELCIHLGWKKVVVQSDSVVAIRAITQTTTKTTQFGLLFWSAGKQGRRGED